MKTALLFTGQGSQFVGMGKDFFEHSQVFREVLEKGEDFLKIPVKKLCFEGPEEELSQTVNLQPVLTLFEIGVYEVLRNETDFSGCSFVSGHSLGEYPALYAGGVLAFEDVLSAVKKRAEFMEECAKKNPSTMYAVLGFDWEKLKEVVEKEGKGKVVIANFNSPNQVVISGKIPEIDQVASKLKERVAKRVIKLKVSGGFHSFLMKEAEERLGKVLEEFEWKEPVFPFVSNVTGKAHRKAEEIKELMKKQVTSSVKWIDCVNFMYEKEVRTFIEIGPKSILLKLVKEILAEKKDGEINLIKVCSYQDLLKISQSLNKS